MSLNLLCNFIPNLNHCYLNPELDSIFCEKSRNLVNFRNKHIERSLYKQCTEEFFLSSLHKDDNVTPDLMIDCLERLLENKKSLRQLNGIHLNIATYYSVLKDGTVCIPWNFIL